MEAVSAVAPEFVSSVVYAERVEGYMNAADRYVNAAGELVKASDVDASARDRLQQIYLGEVGVRERTGRNDGHRVAEYLRYTDLGEGYAWCASFVSWVYGQAGYPEPRTAWSPALFPAKRVIWRRGDKVRPPEPHSGARHLRISSAKPGTDDTNIKDRVSIPQKGDVFGIYFNSVKRIAHAGFVDEWGDKYVVTVEGNTNEAGSREGDGVYRKRRLISSIYRVSSWF
ncbi:peptidoglycan-binding protein [Albibacterium profundi]|uniref:Peptidoglycan-binding protein n=1 Tax=Albibacterium profundi TaxID=3134906 RepID=A0ABV5CA11_9SPHI